MTKVFLIVSFVFVVFSLNSTLFAVPADKRITWGGSGQGQVIFEGDEHAEKGYKCDTCHPSLFQMKKGEARITLAAHTNGQFCGACHNGKTAFGTDDPKKCNECHKRGGQHHKNRDKGKHHD
jgi:c(7)-type cytochrome triheme protein